MFLFCIYCKFSFNCLFMALVTLKSRTDPILLERTVHVRVLHIIPYVLLCKFCSRVWYMFCLAASERLLGLISMGKHAIT